MDVHGEYPHQLEQELGQLVSQFDLLANIAKNATWTDETEQERNFVRQNQKPFHS
jgi:hypothetical protein